MKNWTIAANSLPEYKYGTIYVSDEPWWLHAFFWLVDNIISRPCTCQIRLPNWFGKYRDSDNPTVQYTLRDWYNDVGGLWHALVCGPLLNWHAKKVYPYEIQVEIGYDALKAIFGPSNPDFFLEEAKYERSEV